MKKSNIQLFFFLGLISFVCGAFCWYFFGGEINVWLNTDAPGGNFQRGIGTNKDLWLNGYLGIFFRFNSLGYINWLAIPLMIHFITTLKKRPRWESALFLSLCLTCLFIMIQGYRNERYQLTVYPALLTVIILYGYQVLKEHSRNASRIIIGFVCLILIIAPYPILKKYKIYKEKYNTEIIVSLNPQDLIDYIENKIVLNDEEVILECNQPLLYYHTSKQGLSYTDERMNYFYKRRKNSSEAHKILKENLNVRYILAREPFDWRCKSIINAGSGLVMETYDFKLFKLR